MDRYFLIASTFCFLAAVVHTAIELRAKVFRPMRFNFFAIGLGFIFQTAFLWIRGQALGRCPITNLFEVFVFLAWSVALVYMLVGPAYRLSLMGAFTAPLVLLLGRGDSVVAQAEAVLARLKFAVTTTGTVEEALRILEGIRPDVVVAEPDAASRIRLEWPEHVPVVEMNGELRGDPDALVEAIRQAIRANQIAR